MSELGRLQKIKLQSLFEIYDIDENEKIELDDFLTIADNFVEINDWELDTSIHYKVREQFTGLWHNLQHYADTNQDGSITQEEWFNHWNRIIGSEMGDTLIKEFGITFFSFLDTDNDGNIGVEEYQNFLIAFEIDTDKLEVTFNILDTNQDGKLTLEECMELGLAFFNSNDPNNPGNHAFGLLEGA